ncbi:MULTISPECIES: hypothetical protein [Nocardia]|uniref:hypothetical protein n=1 Tax=Nocardia TaxID=1817 RepID=UPI000BEF2153|nr:MULTISPECIES: hypothetical protein [Nocardia]MBF6186454.1 hypothetical protein [Nocardia farcinica]MBF6313852.1 hypothetical protein [Nocardia farcinica]MBF6409286.1 hypothetical protein [Nocardia farcinica]PEH74792.1 hypothetical protein CRM89_01295 [Nocardia sp. FDAARGOS_372]UEX24306.1 hypothetical protein LMJ57_07525 [Nocardia farcinica]
MVAGLDIVKAALAGMGQPVLAWGVDGHQRSAENNARDESLREDGAKFWEGDRQHIQNEWGQLSSQYNNPAPQAITNPESFETWTHQQIWEALNGKGDQRGVEQAEINAGADGWRRLCEQATLAIDTFENGVEEDIERLWKGRASNAAMDATLSYAKDFRQLTVGFQQVANGIDLIQGYLDQAKRSVAPPEEVSWVDEFLGHIPGNGVLKLGQHRANEATAHAQEVMKVYQQGAETVDKQTPILPEPTNPVSNPGTPPGGGGSGTPGGNPGAGTPGTNPAGTNPSGNPNTPAAQDPSSRNDPTAGDDPADDSPYEDPQGTNPQSSEPQSTVPQSTVPSAAPPGSSLSDPSGRPNSSTPSLGSPGLGAPGLGSPGATPSPGSSVPGAKTAQPTGLGAAATRAATGAAGRAGMPGMGAMGAGAGRRGDEDESEHKIPDYLVQDRTTELLGEQPRVLPPGGVIGG